MFSFFVFILISIFVIYFHFHLKAIHSIQYSTSSSQSIMTANCNIGQTTDVRMGVIMNSGSFSYEMIMFIDIGHFVLPCVSAEIGFLLGIGLRIFKAHILWCFRKKITKHCLKFRRFNKPLKILKSSLTFDRSSIHAHTYQYCILGIVPKKSHIL